MIENAELSDKTVRDTSLLPNISLRKSAVLSD